MSDMESVGYFYDDLGTKAYKRIKEMIVRGELTPGQKLIQEEMASILGVSRTPLLQAIGKLERENLVVTIPRRGSHVRQFTKQEFLHIFDIRGQLEPMGAYQAAHNISADLINQLEHIIDRQRKLMDKPEQSQLFEVDKKFHLAIMKMSGNTFLYDIIETHINALCDSEKILKTPNQRLEEHLTLVQALRDGDPYSVRELMYYHVNAGARNKLEAMLNERTKI